MTSYDDIVGHKDVANEWLSMRSGNRVYISADPEVVEKSTFTIEDVSRSLSRECRYAGQIDPEFYSVAQHSVLVSRVVVSSLTVGYQGMAPSADLDAHIAVAGLYALMHDADEAFMRDMLHPTKVVLKTHYSGKGSYADLSSVLLAEILRRCGFVLCENGEMCWSDSYQLSKGSTRKYDLSDNILVALTPDINERVAHADNLVTRMEVHEFMSPRQQLGWKIMEDTSPLPSWKIREAMTPNKADNFFLSEYARLQRVLRAFSVKNHKTKSTGVDDGE